ncbi:unnamed protein product [Musa acuminata subsp. malaccensis]|uniref:(wild Malaysian banana) hypothetical protein n=1 Tax=Musa acuminata subsp. malaccensis TaxID=214687 RepID=A0A8D7B499_MUSAM|nr:unnamed protein product [Musa acuminata subsp. malaccensis]
MIRVAQAVCHHLVTRFPRLNLRLSLVKKLFAFPLFLPCARRSLSRSSTSHACKCWRACRG